jgi:hypothetical protein
MKPLNLSWEIKHTPGLTIEWLGSITELFRLKLLNYVSIYCYSAMTFDGFKAFYFYINAWKFYFYILQGHLGMLVIGVGCITSSWNLTMYEHDVPVPYRRYSQESASNRWSSRIYSTTQQLMQHQHQLLRCRVDSWLYLWVCTCTICTPGKPVTSGFTYPLVATHLLSAHYYLTFTYLHVPLHSHRHIIILDLTRSIEKKLHRWCLLIKLIIFDGFLYLFIRWFYISFVLLIQLPHVLCLLPWIQYIIFYHYSVLLYISHTYHE